MKFYAVNILQSYNMSVLTSWSRATEKTYSHSDLEIHLQNLCEASCQNTPSDICLQCSSRSVCALTQVWSKIFMYTDKFIRPYSTEYQITVALRSDCTAAQISAYVWRHFCDMSWTMPDLFVTISTPDYIVDGYADLEPHCWHMPEQIQKSHYLLLCDMYTFTLS